MIGLCSKGTDGQMYTSSSKKLIHTFELIYLVNKIILQKLLKKKAKVCMTVKRKTTYCSEI